MNTVTVAPVDQRTPVNTRPGNKTVMVVDDGDLIRMLVAYILRNQGYHVVEAGNGNEAFDLLKKTDIDVVITDLNMPELDGIGLVKKIRSTPAYRYLPVVMISSELLEGRKEKAYAAGVNEWLPKPLIQKQLVQLLVKYA